MKIFSMLTLITAVFISQQAYARRTPSAIPPRQLEIEIQNVMAVKPLEHGISQETMNLAIPTDLKETSNSGQVGAQIVDHNIQNLLQGRYLRNSTIVQSAQKVQQLMKPSMSLGESEGGIHHNVNLEIEAMQSVAKLNYTGYMDTNIIYSPKDEAVEVSVSEKLSDQTSLSLAHESKSDLSMLKLNFDW